MSNASRKGAEEGKKFLAARLGHAWSAGSPPASR